MVFEKLQNSNGMAIAIVYMTLLIDNMMLSSVVSILPEYFFLQHQHNQQTTTQTQTTTITYNVTTTTTNHGCTEDDNTEYLKSENIYIGILFSSKPIVQFISNIFAGPLVDRIGFDVPMFCGYVIMFLSGLLFALGKSYTVLLVARAIQGFGSSLASTSGMSLLADKFVGEKERGRALGHALGGLAMGVLLGPTFGSLLYTFAGKSSVFYTLCGMTVIVATIQLLTRRLKIQHLELPATPLRTLLKDPYILLAAGTLFMANCLVSMIETGMPIWMIETMCAKKWQFGICFLPFSVSYMITIYILAYFGQDIARWIWCLAGIITAGVGVFALSFVTTIYGVFPPGFLVGIALGFVDNNIFPIMGHLVDTRHAPVYGSVYAIADAALCASFAVGPLTSGPILSKLSFPWLMRIMTGCCVIFAPLVYFLRIPTLVDSERIPILHKRLSSNDSDDEAIQCEEGNHD